MKDKASWRHVYGPVPSRRLGRSLGVDPVPFKTCNFDCVYCQLGRTVSRTRQRREFFPTTDIIREMKSAIDLFEPAIDALTIVGDGEPTLHSGLGTIIREAKQITQHPVAVITNGSLLAGEKIRRELAAADIVMPTLDAAEQSVFQRINRPGKHVRVEKIIRGLAAFRKMFKGRFWLEVMLVRGLNDRDRDLKALQAACTEIDPDRVIINVPVRPPAEAEVQAPEPARLERARELLKQVTVIDQPESNLFALPDSDHNIAVVWQIMERHPLRHNQISSILSRYSPESISAMLSAWQVSGRVKKLTHRGTVFYTTGGGTYTDNDGSLSNL